MSSWTTSREQWVAWIAEQTPAQTPRLVLDAWDGQFRRMLHAAPFGDAAGHSGAGGFQPLPSSDSMPTLVRAGDADDDVDAAQTLVHGARADIAGMGSLEVGLQSPQGSLQIELEPAQPATSGNWYIPPLTERSVVGPAPSPPDPPDFDRTMIAPAPSGPFAVPTLPIAPVVPPSGEHAVPQRSTEHTVLAPPPGPPAPPPGPPAPPPTAQHTVPAPPPPPTEHTVLAPPPRPPTGHTPAMSPSAPVDDPVPSPAPPAHGAAPQPPPGTPHAVPPTPSARLAPPPPRPPANPDGLDGAARTPAQGQLAEAIPAPTVRTGNTLVPIDAEPGKSQTAGVIVTAADGDPELAPPRRSSKIVVAPPPADAILPPETDIEADVLESSDLLEAMEPHEDREDEEILPPPPTARPAAPPPPPPETASAPRPADASPALITGQTLPPGGPRHWSESVFAAHFAALTRLGADRIAAGEVEFIAEITQLAANATVIDVGSGEGRHANAFAERGHRTVGLDMIPAQIQLASEAHGPSVGKLRWVCQDVRDRGLGEQFDLVACLGTTLGLYDEPQNRAVLEALRDLCAPGGRLVIHVVNRDYVVPRLPARTWWQGQGCLVLDEVDVHEPSSRIHVKRTIVFEDGRQFEHVYDVRVYAVHELVAACEAAGLTVLEVSGSRHIRGQFFGATSPDIWLVARR